MSADYAYFKQMMEEDVAHAERLETQINDLTDLHQHEVTNIKQVCTQVMISKNFYIL